MQSDNDRELGARLDAGHYPQVKAVAANIVQNGFNTKGHSLIVDTVDLRMKGHADSWLNSPIRISFNGSFS
jgi:hypothetical protein